MEQTHRQEPSETKVVLEEMRYSDRLERWTIIGSGIAVLILMTLMMILLIDMSARLDEAVKTERILADSLQNLTASDAEQRQFRMLIEDFLAAEGKEERQEILEELRRRNRESESESQGPRGPRGPQGERGPEGKPGSSEEDGSGEGMSTTTSSSTTTSTTTTEPPLICIVGNCIQQGGTHNGVRPCAGSACAHKERH